MTATKKLISKQFMPRWSWEVCKMFMYMIFPVACFHFFNSPQIFEEAITKAKLENYTPTPVERQKKIEQIIADFNEKRSLKVLQELEKKQKQAANV